MALHKELEHEDKKKKKKKNANAEHGSEKRTKIIKLNQPSTSSAQHTNSNTHKIISPAGHTRLTSNTEKDIRTASLHAEDATEKIGTWGVSPQKKEKERSFVRSFNVLRC